MAELTVVGAHGGEVFGAAARHALATAEVVVGAPRHLALLDPAPTGTLVELTGALDGALGQVDAELAAGRRVCVVAAGDPGFFGIARLLRQRFGSVQLRIHPAPSSVALAFAAAGLHWDDALVVSAHGRPLADGLAALVRAPKAAVLVAPDQPPETVGVALLGAGCGPRQVWVASRLGEPGAAITATDLDGLAAGRFDPVSVVVLVDPAAGPATRTVRWGAGEHTFVHRDGMITKSEVRAVALSKFPLRAGQVLWDVGAGSGSVGIEAARLCPGIRVIAVEPDPDACQAIAANAAGEAVTVVAGRAPAALVGLDDPDHVFVGGGGDDAFDAAVRRVRPGGTVVATWATLGRAARAAAALGHLAQVQISRGEAVGTTGEFRLEALNPVFVTWGVPR